MFLAYPLTSATKRNSVIWKIIRKMFKGKIVENFTLYKIIEETFVLKRFLGTFFYFNATVTALATV